MMHLHKAALSKSGTQKNVFVAMQRRVGAMV